MSWTLLGKAVELGLHAFPPGTTGWLRSAALLVVFQGRFPDVNCGDSA